VKNNELIEEVQGDPVETVTLLLGPCLLLLLRAHLRRKLGVVEEVLLLLVLKLEQARLTAKNKIIFMG
jgi:hypothetical protein